jgi:predicted NUDIX family NTP pyrophosphohydrolase
LLWLIPVGEWEGGGVVWRNKMGEEGVCWLYSPEVVFGELGQRGGREVGAQPRHWLGVAV